jgi:hypothetical protein
MVDSEELKKKVYDNKIVFLYVAMQGKGKFHIFTQRLPE